MSESHTLGQKGELLAEQHLRQAGYKILHRNWKSGKKELDIVAENKDFIVFVEVKTRTENFLVDPASAVARKKRESIIFAADAYIRKYDINKESRFDVIIVISKGKTHDIDHIEGAYYPTLR